MTFMNPIVQSRIRSTLLYFGGGLGATGLLVGALRNSSLAYTNPWILFGATIACLIGTHMTDYNAQPVLKHALWMGFIGSMGLSLVPLINMAGMPIVYDAMFATGFSMAALGAVAYNAPSE